MPAISDRLASYDSLPIMSLKYTWEWKYSRYYLEELILDELLPTRPKTKAMPMNVIIPSFQKRLLNEMFDKSKMLTSLKELVKRDDFLHPMTQHEKNMLVFVASTGSTSVSRSDENNLRTSSAGSASISRSNKNNWRTPSAGSTFASRSDENNWRSPSASSTFASRSDENNWRTLSKPQ